MAALASLYYISETLKYPYNGKIQAITGPMFSAKCYGPGTRLIADDGRPVDVSMITRGTALMTTVGPSMVLDVYDVTCDCVRITELSGYSHLVSADHMVPILDGDRLRLVRAADLCSYGSRKPLVDGVVMCRMGSNERVGFTAEPVGQHPTRGIVMTPGYQYLVLESGTLSHNSSALTDELERQRIAKRNIILIRPDIDRRYDDRAANGGLVLHSGKEYARSPIIRARQLADIDLEVLMRYDVIGIDEIGMFDDVLSVVEWANLGKRVVCCGIIGDYRLANFRNVHLLLPHCEKIIHKAAVCTKCGSKASYTKRITEETDTLVVGGEDKYTALCRKCYWTWP